MSTLAELRNSLNTKIQDMELFQDRMTSPVQYHYQETEIESIYNIISEAYANLLQIAISDDRNIKDSEINNFKASIKNIGDRTSLHTLLRDMKATQPLSQETIETNPNKAVTWLLQ